MMKNIFNILSRNKTFRETQYLGSLAPETFPIFIKPTKEELQKLDEERSNGKDERALSPGPDEYSERPVYMPD